MNYRFRKKPIEVEAFQMTRERRSDSTDWPQWLHDATHYLPYTVGAVWLDRDAVKLVIGTLEGNMRVDWGDYIIQGVNGELYTRKPDIFEKTYESL